MRYRDRRLTDIRGKKKTEYTLSLEEGLKNSEPEAKMNESGLQGICCYFSPSVLKTSLPLIFCQTGNEVVNPYRKKFRFNDICLLASSSNIVKKLFILEYRESACTRMRLASTASRNSCKLVETMMARCRSRKPEISVL